MYQNEGPCSKNMTTQQDYTKSMTRKFIFSDRRPWNFNPEGLLLGCLCSESHKSCKPHPWNDNKKPRV